MSRNLHSIARFVWVLLLPGCCFLFTSGVLAAERAMPVRDANPDDETVEFFAAVESGQIEAKLIQLNSLEARLMVKNNTRQPLNIQMPDAFAGAPVLAQIGGGGGFGGGGGGGQQASGGGGGGFGGGGGQFNVPAERLGEVKFATVCLEHGKDEPRPAIPYEIVPIEQFSDSSQLAALLKMVGTGEYSRAAEQAAAWHIASGMSWEELAAKKIRRANGVTYPYFTAEALRAAVHMTQVAKHNAEPSATDGDGYDNVDEKYRRR